MKIFVLRFRHIAVFAALIAGIFVICSFPGTVSVFNDSDRKIPVYSVERNDNRISLTFDCAWNDYDIDEILSVLDVRNIKATFFVTGKWAEDYPESVKRIFEKGHEIGNHSYNHADYTKMTKNEIIKDLEKCDKAVAELTGECPRLMRAPSGGYNNTVISAAEEMGKSCIQWSVDGLDYITSATEESIKKRISETKKGDIILMHNGTKLTAEVLPEITDELAEKYEFVKVSELIYENGYIIDHTGRQMLLK